MARIVAQDPRMLVMEAGKPWWLPEPKPEEPAAELLALLRSDAAARDGKEREARRPEKTQKPWLQPDKAEKRGGHLAQQKQEAERGEEEGEHMHERPADGKPRVTFPLIMLARTCLHMLLLLAKGSEDEMASRMKALVAHNAPDSEKAAAAK